MHKLQIKFKYIGSSPKCIKNIFHLYADEIFVLQTYSLICFAYNDDHLSWYISRYLYFHCLKQIRFETNFFCHVA